MSVIRMIGWGFKIIAGIVIVTSAVTIGVECSGISIAAIKKGAAKIRKKVNNGLFI